MTFQDDARELVIFGYWILDTAYSTFPVAGSR